MIASRAGRHLPSQGVLEPSLGFLPLPIAGREEADAFAERIRKVPPMP